MEPVSAAILAAAAAGLAQGASDTVAAAVADAYNALKRLIRERFGARSRVATAVDDLEEQPASQGRQVVVQEELESSGAARDTDIIDAAKAVLDALAAHPAGGTTNQQHAVGNNIAQAGQNSTATVKVSGQ
jgi:hypothetical protein